MGTYDYVDESSQLRIGLMMQIRHIIPVDNDGRNHASEGLSVYKARKSYEHIRHAFTIRMPRKSFYRVSFGLKSFRRKYNFTPNARLLREAFYGGGLKFLFYLFSNYI